MKWIPTQFNAKYRVTLRKNKVYVIHWVHVFLMYIEEKTVYHRFENNIVHHIGLISCFDIRV